MPEPQSGSLFASLIVSIAMATALAAQCEVEEELAMLSVMESDRETGFTRTHHWPGWMMMSWI